MAPERKKFMQPQAQHIQTIIDPSGPSELRQVKYGHEAWSDFTLDDETIIRTKTIVVSARWMKGQFSLEGEPVYYVKTKLFLTTISNPKFRRKATPKAQKRRRKKR